MKLICRRLVMAAAIITAAFTFPIFSPSTQTGCSASIVPVPHQGGGQTASTVFGAQADISYGNPVFGCTNLVDSYTDEWVMVVGPGPSAWIQVGWERDPNWLGEVHFWYQYMGPNIGGPFEGHFPPDTFPVSHVRTYRIEAITDPGGSTSWLIWADSTLLNSIPASTLGWPVGGQYGTDAQWSGEVSYVESEMGGSINSPVYIG